ncbi:hypothetical protein GGF37_000596 [Kickxella alabastrina]|nr:hypothetical protein GGF37_000596 [Kickxella alabastrina]
MTDSNSLQGKVALITGALTAVGRQLAHRLSALGASLALVDSPSDGTGEQLSAILPTHTIYIQSDLRQQQDVRLMIEAAVLTFGHLDILVNNAHSLADETSDAEDVQRICDSIDVNFRAPVLASWVFSRYVRQAGKQGVVVNVTAMAGLVPGRGREVYGATNAGLIHFTEASRGRKNDVRVCALAPYYVDGLVDGGGGGRMLPGNKLGAALTMSCEQVVEAVMGKQF